MYYYERWCLMMTFEKLITEIGFTQDEKNEIMSFSSDENTREFRDFAMFHLMKDDCESLNSKVCDDTTYGMAALVAMLCKALLAWSEYEKRGISYDIYKDTMSDIKVWAYNYRRVYGKLGLSDLAWVNGSVVLFRFKLGRLQYNFTEFTESSSHDISVGLKNGDKMLDVHIQQEGSFTDELCGESLELAKTFYRKYFPEYDFKGFICHSWLLSPGLSQVLPETSNIIKFGKRFTIIENQAQNDGQAIERIFDTKFKDSKAPLTSLQIKARKLLDEGGHLGNALGVILVD